VESIDLLRDHWPAANRGQALITTRNHSFAFEPADGGLEITTWDTETGSRFLLHLLATDISTDLKENEMKYAHELSQKLSGHALAICQMAGLIHRCRWSIAEFMEIYMQHPSEMHGVSGIHFFTKALSDGQLLQVAYAFEKLTSVREKGPLPFKYPKKELKDVQGKAQKI